MIDVDDVDGDDDDADDDDDEEEEEDDHDDDIDDDNTTNNNNSNNDYYNNNDNDNDNNDKDNNAPFRRDGQVHLTLYNGCINVSILGLMLGHVGGRDPSLGFLIQCKRTQFITKDWSSNSFWNCKWNINFGA